MFHPYTRGIARDDKDAPVVDFSVDGIKQRFFIEQLCYNSALEFVVTEFVFFTVAFGFHI